MLTRFAAKRTRPAKARRVSFLARRDDARHLLRSLPDHDPCDRRRFRPDPLCRGGAGAAAAPRSFGGDRLGGGAGAAALRGAAALLHVRQPQAQDARRAAARAAAGRRRRRRRRGRFALGAPPRPLDGPGAGRRLPEPAHPRRRRRGPRRPARAGRRRHPDDRRLHLHPRHRRPRRRGGPGPAQPGRARRQGAAPDRRHRRLARRPARHEGAEPLRRPGGEVRAAVPLDPARPRQPAQPPQDARRRRRAAVVRRAQLRRRIFRRRSGQARRAVAAQPRLARPQLRPARRTRGPRLRAVREGLGLCESHAGRCPMFAAAKLRAGALRRSPSSCRAGPSRSTTRCNRCWFRAASWRNGGCWSSRRISFPTPAC